MTAPSIILASGGTGGHMAPADALAVYLNNQGSEVHLITDSRGNAYTNMLQGFDRLVLKTKSTGRGGIVGKLLALFSIVPSVFEARRYLKRHQAKIVIGFGGYPSLPAVLAARSLSIPYVLHEQNAVLGRVNRFLGKGAKHLALTYENTFRLPAAARAVVTGNPVRKLDTDGVRPRSFHDARRQILILGGSQGARILSDIVPAALASLGGDIRASLHIYHQARPEDVARTSDTYKKAGISANVQPYFDNVPAIMKSSHLAICRAGASTIAELTASACPAILVPLKIAADDHQSANAAAFSSLGGGVSMSEHEFTVENLANRIKDWLSDSEKLVLLSQKLAKVDTNAPTIALAKLIQDAVKET